MIYLHEHINTHTNIWEAEKNILMKNTTRLISICTLKIEIVNSITGIQK